MSLVNDRAHSYFAYLDQHTDLSFLNKEQLNDLKKVLGLSDFINDALLKSPEYLEPLFSSGLLELEQRTLLIKKELQKELAIIEDEHALHKALRLFRRKHMVIIAWRELLGKSDLDESFEHISYLAEQLIFQSMSWLYNKQCIEQGTPKNPKGIKQPLYIFAMGKLGGQELNFSSDIDLIFTYPERGQTVGGRRSIDNQLFFIKLGQRIIAALHQITVDGFVYRVDMRLRPFGDSGPLVSCFASLEDYYQSHGREWERYAMVKARVIGEKGPYKLELEALLKPFVYRRYVDFSAIESLRKMKAMISAEVRRKGLKNNIKLGMGGIREIEFVVQAFQLIRGGKNNELRCRGLQQALKVLANIGEMESNRVQVLLRSYRFLRRVENIIQQIGDKQTQTLPEIELDRCRLIEVMGFSSWFDFELNLQQVMTNVHNEFNWVVSDKEPISNQTESAFCEIWELALSQQEMVELLLEKGMSDPNVNPFALQLLNLKEELSRKPIGQRGYKTVEKLLPKIINRAISYSDSVVLMERVSHLLIKIVSRTAYLDLLNENTGALDQLLKLCDASERLTYQLARHPILLDELLDPKHLYNPIEVTHYKSELQQFMLRVPEEDMEQQMDSLRQFKQMQFLHISAADIVGAIELPKVSDHLTALSEALLGYVVQLAWTQMVERFGSPSNVISTDRKGFAVIGYGKMGGFELGYGSDLDLVFVHDNDIKGVTSGPKETDNQRFYLRLAQRIIHLFSTRTNSGVLYEIDMRLRPSGGAGLLSIGVEGYKKYLLNEAWTWEHQALVRARVVYADQEISEDFNRVRKQVLSLPRDRDLLIKEITEMRTKMRAHLNRAKAEQFDLKQSSGGMVDIEFIAQYLVLVNAHQSPKVQCQWSDNLRIFEVNKELGFLTEIEEKALNNAYCCIRDAAHRLTLNKQSRIVSDQLFIEERKSVLAIWQKLFG